MNDEKILLAYLQEIAKEDKEEKKSKAKKNEEIAIETINELENW